MDSLGLSTINSFECPGGYVCLLVVFLRPTVTLEHSKVVDLTYLGGQCVMRKSARIGIYSMPRYLILYEVYHQQS